MSQRLQVGQLVLSRFVAERVLHQSPRAALWLASTRGHDQQSVIKVFGAGKAQGQWKHRSNEVRRLQELERLVRVRHPCLARILAVGPVKRSTVMVCEHLPGPTLDKVLEQRAPLPLLVALKLSSQLLEALMTLHRAGVVHRRLCPEHVILHKDRRGHVSCTLLAAGTSVDTRSLSVYQCPEEHHGPPADIHALGVLMWWMLTGSRLPDKGPLSRAHWVGLEPRTEARLPVVSKELEVLVRAMLWTEPSRRPQGRLIQAQLKQLSASVLNPAPPEPNHQKEFVPPGRPQAAALTPSPSPNDSVPDVAALGSPQERDIKIFLGCMPIWQSSLELAIRQHRLAEAQSIARDIARGAAVVECDEVVKCARNIIADIDTGNTAHLQDTIGGLRHAHQVARLVLLRT